MKQNLPVLGAMIPNFLGPVLQTVSLPLSHSQLGCLRAMRLIHPFWQASFCRQFWHHGCFHCSGHQGFLLESLGVSCNVSHHHNNILAALSQLCICILPGETLRQGPFFDSQVLGHHINSLTSVSFLCLHRYNIERKGTYGLSIHSGYYFIVSTGA